MGELVDGVWQKGGLGQKPAGAFERTKATFRSTLAPEDVEAGRFHLYVSHACPWAQRAMIVRALRGLEDAIGMTAVDPHMSDEGWSFGGDGGEKDPLFDKPFLRDIYTEANAKFSGRVTVPVLWDKKKRTIVNNESRELMRILDTAFDPLAAGPTLAPEPLRPLIEERLDEIYDSYNNGVYRAGFATKQDAYDSAVREVFATLDRMDALLGKQRFLCGDTLTEADVAFFTTSLRFDLVYYAHFKCNIRRAQDYPNVWRFVRELHAMPAVKSTCHLDQIKLHYYWSQTPVNPTRIVPVGPTLLLE